MKIKNNKKSRMQNISKLFFIFFIFYFYYINIAFSFYDKKNDTYFLSPKSSINDDSLKKRKSISYSLISYDNAKIYGVIVNKNTNNLSLNKRNFKIPPYLDGRVIRVHLTKIDGKEYEYQKMGIGKGQRKKTIAIVLIDIKNFQNQLMIKTKGESGIELVDLETLRIENISLVKDKTFLNLQRQDSLLERTDLGIEFLDKIDGINFSGVKRAKTIVHSLKEKSIKNPKLKTFLPVTLAFFSKDYILNFSRELRKMSSVSVYKDREQRGRFIAIVDNLNSSNSVVFERIKDNVVLIADEAVTIVEKLSKETKTRSLQFTDLKEGAKFCQQVSRALVEFSPSPSSSSLTLRTGVNLHLGINNNNLSILKVNQITQSTSSGYQLKQRFPLYEENIYESFPLYILSDDYNNENIWDNILITWKKKGLLFFPKEETFFQPVFINYNLNGQNKYYRKIDKNFVKDGITYIVYSEIPNNLIVTKIFYKENGAFIIEGINWLNGKAVEFENIKQISLPSLISQLRHSKYIKIDKDLLFRFALNEISGTPIRALYTINKKGLITQEGTRYINSLNDFSIWQNEHVDNFIAKILWDKEHAECDKSQNIFQKIAV